jgi:TonB family protein
MTSTIKNSPELNSPGKPGAPSQNSENKAGLSPRSNPVCLEVNVTIRSLPNEAGGQTQPIREDGKTVIVFDNGAVLRSTLNLPVGLTVILSNPGGRDVVSRVVGGRNLPNLKGYVEVEFIEPVNDFWGIHRQDIDPAPLAVAAPPAAAPPVPRETPAPPTPAPSATPRMAAPVEAPAKLSSVSLGVGAKFEDIGEPARVPSPAAMRESKTEKVRPSPELLNKDTSDYNLSEVAKATSLANWLPPGPELPAEKTAIPAKRESSSIISPAPANSHDFMSKGLMAYEQPSSSSSASDGRIPLIVGVAALVLAGVCGVVFFMHRGNAPIPVAKTAVVSQPSTQPAPPAANTVPDPVQEPRDDAAQVAAQTQNQTLAQPVSVEQPQPAAAVAPVPAVVTGPVASDGRTEARPDSRNVRRQEKSAVAAKQPEPSSPRRPVIANLKMGSPSAPNKNRADPGEGAAPITEIASADPGGSTPPAGLLTSAGRISNPPSPPPGAPAPAAPAPVTAPRTVRDPKLISSVRPEYPTAARQSSIQGSVTVAANIDENGKVVNAKALNGPLLLRQAAENSVRQWKYSPGQVDGKPAPSQVTVNVEFRMN